jgi:hypothetical protein
VLLRNAEFQIMLSELRYPPIQHRYVRCARRAPISWSAGTDGWHTGEPRDGGSPCSLAFRDRERPTQNDLELRMQRVASAPQSVTTDRQVPPGPWHAAQVSSGRAIRKSDTRPGKIRLCPRVKMGQT